jgi:LPXTG-site transpeptidase (sortase) family protein
MRRLVSWVRGHRLLSAAVVVVVLAAGLVTLLLMRPDQPPKKSSSVVSYSTDRPSEAPVTPSTYHSTAGPTEPKYIRLPTIGAEGFVQKMGIDQHGAVAAPNNVNLAGWYVDSLSPGEEGLSIIDGHVDGLKGPGIFLKLSKLAPGDSLTVELGNGTLRTFVVKKVSSVSDAQAAKTVFARDYALKRQLNLITCGGSFNRQAHKYTQRVIVVAEGVV